MASVLKAGSVRLHADVGMSVHGLTLGDELRARHDAELAAAYEAGLADGAAAARASGEAAVPTLVQAVRDAAAETVAAIDRQRRAETDVVVETAFALATWIVDREVDADPTLLSRRIDDALGSLLPTATPAVRVAPALASALESWATDTGVAVHADATLRPGEARVDAGHAGADLSYTEAFRRLGEVLHLEGEDGTLPVTHPELRTHPGPSPQGGRPA